MKRASIVLIIFSGLNIAYCQNYIGGQLSIYGPQYNKATIIAGNGSILVGSGGNWFFAGKISGIDKSTIKTPTTKGLLQRITFSGTGRYSGTALIDGYASVTGKTGAFVLPIGDALTPYPVTVAAGTAFTAAYFDGSSGTQTVVKNGTTITVFSAYIDVPSSTTAGNYSITYPGGLTNASSNLLLNKNGSNNFDILAKIPIFQLAGGAVAASLPNLSATQLYFGNSNITLPVNFLSFTAVVEACTLKLAWQTASENNSNNYEIESSLDGNNFKKVGTLASKNNTLGSSYGYLHNLLSDGTIYFRIKAIDNDGSFVYSRTLAVTCTAACSANMSIKVWPNPTSNNINIEGLANGSRLFLTTISGQRLAEETATGSSQIMNLSNYAKGIYLLSIHIIDGSIKTFKVLKKNSK